MSKIFKLSSVAAVAIVAMSSFSGCGSSSSTPVVAPTSSVQAADGYVIDLNGTSAKANCGDGKDYNSSLTVGAEGKLTFTGVTLTDACIITVAENAFIDVNNDGNFTMNNPDTQIGAPMRALGGSPYVSPLTSLVVEKYESFGGTPTDKLAAVKELNDLVKTFDPVKAATTVATSTNAADVTKAKKLMILGEIAKTVIKNGSAATLKDLNTTSITDTTVTEVNALAVTANLPTAIKTATVAKAEAIQELIKILPSLDTTLVKVNALLTQVSDGHQNITTAITKSLVTASDANISTIIATIVKADVNTTTLTANIATADTKVSEAIAAVAATPAKLSLGTAITFGSKSVALTAKTFTTTIDKNSSISSFYNVAFSGASVNKSFTEQMLSVGIKITKDANSTIDVLFPHVMLTTENNSTVNAMFSTATITEKTAAGDSLPHTYQFGAQTTTGLAFNLANLTGLTGSLLEGRLNNYLKTAGNYSVVVSVTGFNENLTVNYSTITGTVTVK